MMETLITILIFLGIYILGPVLVASIVCGPAVLITRYQAKRDKVGAAILPEYRETAIQS